MNSKGTRLMTILYPIEDREKNEDLVERELEVDLGYVRGSCWARCGKRRRVEAADGIENES